MVLLGAARIAAPEPGAAAGDHCPALVGRDYTAELRRLGQAAAEAASEGLDREWTVLADRLGVSPSRETQSLYLALLEDDTETTPAQREEPCGGRALLYPCHHTHESTPKCRARYPRTVSLNPRECAVKRR